MTTHHSTTTISQRGSPGRLFAAVCLTTAFLTCVAFAGDDGAGPTPKTGSVADFFKALSEAAKKNKAEAGKETTEPEAPPPDAPEQPAPPPVDDADAAPDDSPTADAPSDAETDEATPEGGNLFDTDVGAGGDRADPPNKRYEELTNKFNTDAFGGQPEDLATIIKYFSDALGLDYIINPGAQGRANQKVVFHLPHISGERRYTREEMERLFDALLNITGLHRRQVDGIWHIEDSVPPQGTSPLSNVRFDDSGEFRDVTLPVIQFVRLRHLNPAHANGVIRQLLSNRARVYNLPDLPWIVVIDDEANIGKLMDILDFIDVDPTIRRHYVLEHADPDEMVRDLRQIFGSEKNVMGQPIIFVPISRLQMIVVHNMLEEDVSMVEEYIRLLDNRGSVREHTMVTEIYRMETEDAVAIAKTLGTFYRQITAMRKQAQNKKGGGQLPDNPEGVDADNVVILPDQSTNSILVHASLADQKLIAEKIKQLDRQRKQVLIEVLIAEVTLTDNTALGIEWTLLQNDHRNGDSVHGGKFHSGPESSYPTRTPEGMSSVAGMAENLAGSQVGGFRYLVAETDKLLAMLNASHSESRLNVLSSPSILAADGKEAEVKIGDEVPVKRTTTTNDTIETSYDYKEAMIKLLVKPHINENRVVTLDVNQIIKQVTGAAGDAPILSTREVKTTLSVADGQTLVIGGLIKKRQEANDTKVPAASRIPLLGRLFRSERKQNDGTELLVVLTPHVIDTHKQGETEEVMEYIRGTISGALDRPDLEERMGVEPIGHSAKDEPWWRRTGRERRAANVAPEVSGEE